MSSRRTPKCAYSVAVPFLSNEVPPEIRMAPTWRLFRRACLLTWVFGEEEWDLLLHRTSHYLSLSFIDLIVISLSFVSCPEWAGQDASWNYHHLYLYHFFKKTKNKGDLGSHFLQCFCCVHLDLMVSFCSFYYHSLADRKTLLSIN